MRKRKGPKPRSEKPFIKNTEYNNGSKQVHRAKEVAKGNGAACKLGQGFTCHKISNAAGGLGPPIIVKSLKKNSFKNAVGGKKIVVIELQGMNKGVHPPGPGCIIHCEKICLKGASRSSAELCFRKK